MPRVLYIAHYFPPLGGAGVQRTVKFVKYLPEAGFQPAVVTSSGSESGWWSPSDRSMLDEIPDSVKVYRTPAPGVARSPAAGAAARFEAFRALSERAARETAAQLVFVSMSPFQDARVARSVSRQLRIPWVADLRDPWALDEFQVYRSSLHRLAETLKMASALRTASLIVMNTPEAAARLKTLPGFRRKNIISVTNGYDAADFASRIPAARADKFTIVHAGYLHTAAGLHQRRHALQYSVLGRTQSGVKLLARSHYFLLRALDRWLAQDPSIRDRVSVVLVGKPSAVDLEVVQHSAVKSIVQFTGYLSHADSTRVIRAANLLFLPMHEMPPRRRATIVPGKTYEYMATGVPVLACVPEGDAKDFLRQTGTALFCEPRDVGAMSRTLQRQFDEWASGREMMKSNKPFVEQFERRHLTHQLAREMVELVQPAAVRER